MKILIDMNLSPAWVAAFEANDIVSVHWSSIGKADAKDSEIIEFAKKAGYIVFTHDLDFGTLLALTQAQSPSVVQVRSQEILPNTLSDRLIAVLRQNEGVLRSGALLVLDETRERIRILPLWGPK